MSNIELIKSLADLEQDAEVVLYEFDLTIAGGGIIRLHNGMNEKHENVVWKSHEYEAFPMEGEGFEFTAEGAAPTPTLTMSNLDGLLMGIINDLGDIRGSMITRRITSAKYLDEVNFIAGNKYASPFQEDIQYFVLDRVASQNRESITLELAIPASNNRESGREVRAGVCQWAYRDGDCGYTGAAVADIYDIATTDPKRDECSKSIQGCKARFGITAVLPISVAPGTDKLQR